MSIIRSTTFYCDNCSSEVKSGHGLPNGWYQLIHAKKDSSREHMHFCNIYCLKRAAMIVYAEQLFTSVGIKS